MVNGDRYMCDVCGEQITSGHMHFFNVPGIKEKLCCHDKCKSDLVNARDDWKKLPPGPLKHVFQEAMKRS